MKYVAKKSNEQLIAEFIANGGKIQYCRPKLAPTPRTEPKSIITREVLQYAVRPLRAA